MGVGINLFKQLFPEDYYAYQTAHLESSKPVSKVVVGKNLCKSFYTTGSKTIYSTVLWLECDFQQSTTYAISFDGTSGTSFYTNENMFTSSSYFDVTSNRTIVIVTTKGNLMKNADTYDEGRGWRVLKNSRQQTETPTFTDVQIEFGSTATAYEPYTSTIYPLGGDELRGLLKVVDGQLVAYGDVKGSDGIIYRYFEERAYASGDESLPNAITDGTNTVVELTTPTTASGTPFTNPMLCGATEEFTDSRTLKMFCGHDSLYYNSPFKGW